MFKVLISSLVSMVLTMSSVRAEDFLFPSRTLQYKDVIIEQIVLKQPSVFSQYPRTAYIYKICLDGQAFLLMDKDRSQSIAPSFKDGRPETCSVKLK